MKCRCCEREGKMISLIEYKNMPKSAQFFPDEKDVKSENGIDLKLVECPSCGLIQLEGKPVSYYRDVIRAVGVSKEMTAFRMKQFDSWLNRYKLKEKKILEVGCGCGEYMDIMKKLGIAPYGLENRDESVKIVSQKGHFVEKGYFEDKSLRLKNAPFDGFYILNFLEHVPSPNTFLTSLSNNLSQDAIGLVEVPNVDMILRQNLYSELIQDHLMYFTEETLRRLLELNGFDVLGVKPVWHDYIISAEVRKRKPVDVSGFESQRAKLKLSVDAWLKKNEQENLRVAVWGAGHQALANLSLLEIRDKIFCVLDSASFKQNKFTPATHLPIYSPDEIEERNIGAVLVMAAAYSEEIAGILKERFPSVKRAVLGTDCLIEK